MLGIISTQSYITYRSSVFKVCLVIAIAISAFFVGSMYILYTNPHLAQSYGAESAYQQEIASSLLWPSALTVTLSQVQERGAILAVVIIGSLVTMGYTWGTTRSNLTRGVARPMLYLGTAISFIVPVILVGVLIPVVVETVLTGLITLRITETIPAHSVSWFRVILSTIYAALGVMPYAAMAIAMAVITRSTVGVVGGGLGILLAERIMLNIFGLTSVLKYTPTAIYTSLASGKSSLLNIALLIAWITALLIVGLNRFLHQDIPE